MRLVTVTFPQLQALRLILRGVAVSATHEVIANGRLNNFKDSQILAAVMDIQDDYRQLDSVLASAQWQMEHAQIQVTTLTLNDKVHTVFTDLLNRDFRNGLMLGQQDLAAVNQALVEHGEALKLALQDRGEPVHVTQVGPQKYKM